MRIADRRWRLLAMLLVIGGTALTFIVAFAPATGQIAGIDPEVVGFVLIVAGMVVFFPSQLAASRAEQVSDRSSDASSGSDRL